MCFFNLIGFVTLLLQLQVLPSHMVVGSFIIPQSEIQPTHYRHRHNPYHQRNDRYPTPTQQTDVSLAASTDDDSSDANTLREKADRLRREVTEFEDSKREKERSDQKARDEILEKKQDERLRYSVVIPILKGDGSTEMERVDFKPRLTKAGDGTSSPSSVVLAVEAPLPLGIILGEDETLPGAVRVDEVVGDGNGAAAGVRVGDLLRACTACQVTMEMPTWQIMAGGIGRPKTSRMMFSTDGRPFEEVMEAVGSNRIDPEERPAWLVLERNVETVE